MSETGTTQQDAANPLAMEVTARTVGLVLDAPQAFAREDFMAWLNDPQNRVATWHRKGEQAGDYSDVVVHVDSNYEGDSSDMPGDIWKAICDEAYRAHCGGRPELPPGLRSHITVRLTNLG